LKESSGEFNHQAMRESHAKARESHAKSVAASFNICGFSGKKRFGIDTA